MIRLDERRHRLLIVHFVGVTPDDEFEHYLLALTSHVHARTEPTVTIFEMSRARPTAWQRMRQTEWLRENLDAVERTSLGTAFVASSMVVRAALMAILWARPLQQPHVLVGTFGEAETWAQARLREAEAAA